MLNYIKSIYHKLFSFGFWRKPDWESEHEIGLCFYYYTYGVGMGSGDYQFAIYVHLIWIHFCFGFWRYDGQEEE